MPVSFIRQRNAYVGPGNIVSGATAAYSLRAYNAAYATGSNKAVNVRRASDNTTRDILILANGNLDVATANTFAGTDATGTGAITGTTLTFTGGHVGDTVTGTGVTPGTYIVSGSSPTWTVNISQTVASATLTLTWGLYVTEWYDQSGNGNNAVQATAGSQPILLLAGLNGEPSITATGTSELSTPVAQTQPLSVEIVVLQPVSVAGDSAIFANNFAFIGYTGTANEISIFFDQFINATAADGSAHVVQVVVDGTPSSINVDGTSTPGNSGGGGSYSSPFIFSSGGIQFLNGSISEIILWPLALSSGQLAAIQPNAKAYWGTP